VEKKTAIIIIDHGSRYPAANNALDGVVQATQHAAPNVLVVGAHMELADPTIEAAFNTCVEKGATHIIAHPYMLAPGRHAIRDIPNMVLEAAKAHPNVTVDITDPLGLHPNIIQVILDRCGVDHVS
jgi:sirohydrochlorin ferrochelatase